MNALDFIMYTALLLVCGLSLIKGRWPERIIAVAMMVNFGANTVQILRYLSGRSTSAVYSPDVSLAADLVLLGIMGAVALRARPYWTLFPAAFQLLATLVSVIHLSAKTQNLPAYVTAQNTFWWLTLAALAYGLWETNSSRSKEGGGGPEEGSGGTWTRG